MSTAVLTLSETAFDAHVIDNPRPVLVDFYAEWCAPCKSMAPVIAELAEAYRDRLDVYKVDVDQSPALANRLGIRAIPTLILFRDGSAAESIVGAASKGTLETLIQAHTS